MKTLFLYVTSWLAGLSAYAGSCALFYHQTIALTSVDFRAVAISSSLAFTVTFALFYLPLLLALRRLLRGVRPSWAFPAAAALLGILPTACILFYWGGTPQSLLSPEASPFFAMFTVAGLVAGIGFTRIYRRDQAA